MPKKWQKTGKVNWYEGASAFAGALFNRVAFLQVYRRWECLGFGFQAKEDVGQDLYIKFMGFLTWSVIVNGREIVRYSKGRYEINHTDKSEKYLQDIETLVFSPLPVDKKMLEKMVKILTDQKHGTSVVIGESSSISKEGERLCNHNRRH